MYLTALHPRPPYNFPLFLEFLSHFPHPSTEIVHENAYWRVFADGAGMALVRVTAAGDMDAPELHTEIVDQRGTIDHNTLTDRLALVLALTEDRAPFFERAQRDTVLWDVVGPLAGLPMHRSETVFEALAQAIIEQQIAWRAARRAQQWLAEWADRCIEYDGRSYYAFPDAAQIAAASIEDLIPLKITFKRIALLIDIARSVSDGTLELEALRDASPDDAYSALLRIKGIGPWTALVTVGRAFGHYDTVTEGDVALQAAANWFFRGLEVRMLPEDMLALYTRFGEDAGLAANFTLCRWVMDRY
jgi:DNA-3-methyladenine glycosylase II